MSQADRAPKRSSPEVTCEPDVVVHAKVGSKRDQLVVLRSIPDNETGNVRPIEEPVPSGPDGPSNPTHFDPKC
jgi:hypothetical protein